MAPQKLALALVLVLVLEQELGRAGLLQTSGDAERRPSGGGSSQCATGTGGATIAGCRRAATRQGGGQWRRGRGVVCRRVVFAKAPWAAGAPRGPKEGRSLLKCVVAAGPGVLAAWRVRDALPLDAAQTKPRRAWNADAQRRRRESCCSAVALPLSLRPPTLPSLHRGRQPPGSFSASTRARAQCLHVAAEAHSTQTAHRPLVIDQICRLQSCNQSRGVAVV
ncbi:hypothetical protein SVAN01_06788 [Stagonosporopsis vannaccii]|nr:hypothetical protein SVAN01_06788 [Stagonosporopsis vannaccii]